MYKQELINKIISFFIIAIGLIMYDLGSAKKKINKTKKMGR